MCKLNITCPTVRTNPGVRACYLGYVNPLCNDLIWSFSQQTLVRRVLFPRIMTVHVTLLYSILIIKYALIIYSILIKYRK